MKTGKSSFEHVYGGSFWDRMRRLPDEYEMFNRALADLRSDEHQRMAEAYDWSDVNTVVDVGGGAGSLLAAILETQPEKRGVLVDQPEVLPDADQLLSARGVRDRCDFAGGSLFEPIATTGEVWVMCQVLHDWPDATDRLLVIEMLTVPGEPNPGIAVLDMMMLLYFGEARQRTVAEYSELFRATGLEYSRVVSTSSAFSIVEARPV